MTTGQLHLTVIAGTIEATDIEPSPNIGQQIRMPGSGVLIYITPDIARQWIGVLENITAETSK
jgi:hypothetical protein